MVTVVVTGVVTGVVVTLVTSVVVVVVTSAIVVGVVVVSVIAVIHGHAPAVRTCERNVRSRRLFDTTKTLDSAIAAPASIGLSRPSAASGIAATL